MPEVTRHVPSPDGPLAIASRPYDARDEREEDGGSRSVGTDPPISKPEKLLWPDVPVTKQDFADYLRSVSADMLPWLRDRPLTMVRAPDGVGGKRYYQKSAPTYAPTWVKTTRIPAPSAERDVDYVVCQDLASLSWLGNQAVLEFHVAPVRRDQLERPDLLVVDIDPPEDSFEMAVEVAFLVLEVLDDLALPSGIKTTGGKGTARRRADRAARGPVGAPRGRDAADRDRGRAPARSRDGRVPEGEARRPRDAGSLPERDRRDDRGALLTP